MIKSLFITGANGFIGRHLLARLDSQKFDHVYCLTRTDINPRQCAREKNFHWLVGSIFDSTIYNKSLDSVDTVIHLAATTGKAQQDQYFQVNSTGTQHLLDQCKQRGVRNFLYVSSIVVKYKNYSDYYYAQSKRAAERAVIQSGLNYTIVRPTIVLGKDAPSWRAFSSLARLPLIPLIGNGSTQIQPIAVDDLTNAMISIIHEQDFHLETFDLGGPDVLSIEDFLKKTHRLYFKNEPRVVHLPYELLRQMVAYGETLLPSMMPLNAGQLSVFVQDGTITANRLYQKQRPSMKNLDTVLRSLIE